MRKRANKFIVIMLTLLFYEVACAKPNAMWSTPYAEYGAPLHVSSVWTPYVIDLARGRNLVCTLST
jgi:hypothetical protein